MTTPAHQAKRPRTALAGPYGHPFHPMVVTIPIGTWVASIVLDIAAHASDDAGLARAATWVIGIGIVGALVAAVLGLLDLTTIPPGTRARSTALTHMALNLAVVVLFVVSFLLRLGDDAPAGALPLTLSVVALLLLGASGWLGGKLAYHYGVRVADESTQAEGFR